MCDECRSCVYALLVELIQVDLHELNLLRAAARECPWGQQIPLGARPEVLLAEDRAHLSRSALTLCCPHAVVSRPSLRCGHPGCRVFTSRCRYGAAITAQVSMLVLTHIPDMPGCILTICDDICRDATCIPTSLPHLVRPPVVPAPCTCQAPAECTDCLQ